MNILDGSRQLNEPVDDERLLKLALALPPLRDLGIQVSPLHTCVIAVNVELGFQSLGENGKLFFETQKSVNDALIVL